MKRTTKALLAGIFAAASTLSLASCNEKKELTIIDDEQKDLEENLKAVYNLYLENAGNLSYEDWLNSIKGADGKDGKDGKDGAQGAQGVSITSIEKSASRDNVDFYVITLSDGRTSTFNVVNGKDGKDGKDGTQGIQGEKGEKGDTGAAGAKGDTGAQGEQGIQGIQGPKGDKGDTGAAGEDGKTAYASTIVPSFNGYVLPSVGSAVAGDDISFSVVADEGYILTEFVVNGVDVTEEVANNVYATKMVEGGFVVRAKFEKIKATTLVADKLVSYADPLDAIIAIDSLEDDATINLTDDVVLNDTRKITAQHNVVINMNGHKFTNSEDKNAALKANALVLAGSNESKITLKNGSLELNGTGYNNLVLAQDVNVEFDHFDITSSNFVGCGIYTTGNIKTLSIKDSNIDVVSYYAISTNNTTGTALQFDIDGSVLKSTEASGDCAGLMFNVADGVLSINDSVITGDRQGLVARLGTFTLKNSTIEATGKFLEKDSNVTLNNKYLDINQVWKSGNEVPCGALVIGDRTTAYATYTNVDCEKVVLNAPVNAYKLVVSEDKNTIVNTTFDEFTREQFAESSYASFDLYNDSLESRLAEFNEISAKDGYVLLKEDATVSNNSLSVTTNALFDLGGHKLTAERINFVGGTSRMTNGTGKFVNGIESLNGCDLTVDGLDVESQEFCLFARRGATLRINGGTYHSIDNGVIGTNGTVKSEDDQGHNHIIVNAGTFNGDIESSGYIACGIYVANNDVVEVNGGTFNINNGVGILCRSGNTTVGKDVVINILTTENGPTEGKVGDSRVIVSNKAIVLDLQAKYPGGTPTVTNNSSYEVTEIPLGD